MASKILPRYLILALAISLCAIGAILSVFYFQYSKLANELLDLAYNEHKAVLHADFETHFRDQLQDIAAGLSSLPATANREELVNYLERSLAEQENVRGLSLITDGGADMRVGRIQQADVLSATNWTADFVVLQQTVTAPDGSTAQLAVSYDYAFIRQSLARYQDFLLQQRAQQDKNTFLWVALATVLSIAGIIILTTFISRNFTRRIRAIKQAAHKLSVADFGEDLPAEQPDEIGDLALAFKDMRDRLRDTTISRDYLDSVLANMSDAIIITSAKGIITRVNDATERMLLYRENELVGKRLDEIVDIEKGGALIVEQHMAVPREAFLRSRNGTAIPISYTGSILNAGEQKSDQHIFTAQNITERRRAEQRIRYLARIDALTKVPNRMQFQHLLQRAIARAKRVNKRLCLLYIDIDHFKEINDTFGHLAGDATLETLTERLTATLPQNSIIGRLAGDEFAVILNYEEPDDSNNQKLNLLARRLLDRLAEPFYVQGQEVFMTASMGIALYPEDAANVIDLIKNADAALYQAKKGGGNLFIYYVPAMNEAAVERLMTKSKLKRAFERNELLVHYQPKYNIDTGEIKGAEALVRWELPERGMILPSDFIPLAEETNLIVEIGEWVLDRVCRDIRFWENSVGLPGRISVNLSLKQLRQANFIPRFREIMRTNCVEPSSLELEITETTLMEDPARTVKALNELHALGLHLAIDDFGTGYSSLSALQYFPISTLKIDQSFVRDVVQNPDDATIVGTIIHMGNSLKLDVVAEGVESEAQLNFLQTMECNYVQGLLFGDPMSADNFLELLVAQAEGTGTHRALFS